MTAIFTPLIYFTFIVLVVFILFNLFAFIRRARHLKALRNQYSILEVEGGIDSLKNIFKLLNPPFTLEIAVHQLGREVHSYIAVPKDKEDIVKSAGCKNVEDYNIYHTGGTHIGGTLIAKNDVEKNIDVLTDLLKSLDFSKVNDIGDGVVFQFVLGGKKGGKKWESNVRVLASAPTPYQAKEILSTIKCDLPGYRWTEEKSADFIKSVTYRKFDHGKVVVWTLY